MFLIYTTVGGPPGAKATGTHNGFQVGFQVDTTGNTTLCFPVAPRCGYPVLPMVKWTSAATAVFCEPFEAVGAEVHFTRGNTG